MYKRQILAFAGSNNSQSINKELVRYTCNLIDKSKTEVKFIELEHYHAPVYGIDLEKAEGFPADIKELRELMLSMDGFIISSPEHNGMIPAFFKNYIDWLSRVDEGKVFNDKPVLLHGHVTWRQRWFRKP